MCGCTGSCCVSLRNETAAEDLISEVFLDVWRQADRFEGRSAVSTWMLAIARFKALSALRKRPDEELDDETAEAIEERSDNPEVALREEGQERGVAAVPGSSCRRNTGRSSIWSTTTRSPSKKWQRSSVSRRTP